jgi:hypothetical protein
MAEGKKVTVSTIANNKPGVQVSRSVGTVIINSVLVADPNEVNPGVNTKDNK